MIRRLQYKEIDFSKYQKCVDRSLQRNIYADRKILDTLCETWELLVYDDYDFVMPVPIKKKLGFKIVLMPLFCQQLGVFGKTKNEQIERQFLDFLQKNYNVFSYSFNFHNVFLPALTMKKNYFISKQEYPSLRKNYFKGRKSTVKTAQYLSCNEVKREEVLSFIRANFRGLEKEKDLDKFFRYIEFLDDKKQLKIFASFKEDALTNLAIVIDKQNRYSLLGLINDDHYKLDNGASFLIDRILQENIREGSFDFMGGNLRGIEVFFKSFGSELQEYPILDYSRKELMRNFFKK